MQKVHAIEIILVAYWIIFTARKHLAPRLAAAIKANAYDMAKADLDAQKAAQRKRGLLKAAGWGFRVLGWGENVLLVLATAFFAFVVGGLIAGTVFVFDKPL